MEDRRASLLAAAFGSVAIGGFWLARPTLGSVPLKITQQISFPSGGVGLDADAAAVFRVRLPGPVRDAMADNQAIGFRLVDRSGRYYPLLPMSDPLYAGALKLPRGYAARPEGARLEALVAGRAVAACPVQVLPAPEKIDLEPTPSALVGLVYEGGATLRVEPRRPIPADHRWRVYARRTRHAARLDAFAEVPARLGSRWSYDRLTLPYAEEAETVELEVARYRIERQTMTIRVPNLRLERRFGGTALIVDRTSNVPNPLGADVRLPRQYMGPHQPLRHGDARAVTVALSIVPPGQRRDDPREGLRRDRGPMVEILSPAPESLGLRELNVGGGLRRAKAAPTGPVKEGPFTATLRVTFARPVYLDRQRNVVPVRIAPKPWPEPNVGPFFGGPAGYGGVYGGPRPGGGYEGRL